MFGQAWRRWLVVVVVVVIIEYAMGAGEGTIIIVMSRSWSWSWPQKACYNNWVGPSNIVNPKLMSMDEGVDVGMWPSLGSTPRSPRSPRSFNAEYGVVGR